MTLTNRERVIRAIDRKRLPTTFLRYADYILDEMPSATFATIRRWYEFNASVTEIRLTEPTTYEALS